MGAFSIKTERTSNLANEIGAYYSRMESYINEFTEASSIIENETSLNIYVSINRIREAFERDQENLFIMQSALERIIQRYINAENKNSRKTDGSGMEQNNRDNTTSGEHRYHRENEWEARKNKDNYGSQTNEMDNTASGEQRYHRENGWEDRKNKENDGLQTNDVVKDSAETANVIPSETQVVTGHIKEYENSDINYGGNDYSDFEVIGSYDPQYVYNQMDYKDSYGKVGCTATATCIMIAMYRNEEYLPGDENGNIQWKGGYNYRNQEGESLTKVIYRNDNSASREDQLTIAAELAKKGIPSVIRIGDGVPDKNGNSTRGHSVTVIGIKKGADINNITADDILIANPGNGQVMTLAEEEEKYGDEVRATGWGIYIPIEVPEEECGDGFVVR